MDKNICVLLIYVSSALRSLANEELSLPYVVIGR